MPTPGDMGRKRRDAAILHRHRASFLARELTQGQVLSTRQVMEYRDQIMADLDPKSLVSIHRRYLRLSPADKSSLAQLQKDGAHRSVLLQFIAATQDHELDDRPTRDHVFREFQVRQAQRAAHRPFEIAARTAVPVLFVTTCALILPWLAGKALILAGAGLDVTRPMAETLDPIAKPLVDLVMEETGGWLARAGLAVGAWVGWRHAARVLPDLKETMAAPETQVLDSPLGPGNKTWVLHGQLRRIPGPDRHLLAHLLPSELRAFLRGNDAERRDILTRQPPPLLAEVQSVLATHPPGLANFFRALRDLGDLCLPSAWRQGFLTNPRLDLDSRLDRWRQARGAEESSPGRAQVAPALSRSAPRLA